MGLETGGKTVNERFVFNKTELQQMIPVTIIIACSYHCKSGVLELKKYAACKRCDEIVSLCDQLRELNAPVLQTEKLDWSPENADQRGLKVTFSGR